MHIEVETLPGRLLFSSVLLFYVSHSFVSECVQIVPQQQGTVLRPQVTLAQSPMVTLRGQSHSRIIVGQPHVVKQLQTGAGSRVTYTSFIASIR